MGQRIHVICFGNELHGDDGFGPAVFQRLQGVSLPGRSRAFRADTSGLSALDCFEDCDLALLVDAVSGYGPPGSLHVLEPSQMGEQVVASWHGQGVAGLLAHVPHALRRPPQVRLVGAEVATTGAFCLGLSAPVERAVAPCVQHVMGVLREAV